jgi:D-3-phosphoglycerate dehydrogenase
MHAVITDAEFTDLTLERTVLEEAGIKVRVANCRTPEEVIAASRGAVALLVQYAPIDRQVLEALPDLQIVSRYGVGVDSIDLGAAEARGIWVSNVPDYGVEEVASHAFAMSLALVRHLPFFDRVLRDQEWHYARTGVLRRPSSLTFGVVGLGRIGRTVAERAKCWFGHVIGHDPYLPKEMWPEDLELLDLLEVFGRSNIVSLHLPLTGETHQLVNASLLARMPQGSYLVNTARGKLIHRQDLIQALDKGQLAGAALDVLPEEPPLRDDPLLRHPRILLSPHAAWFSKEAEEDLRRKTALNVAEWATKGQPLYAIVRGR